MREVVFLLEEPSARAMLVGFLPKIISGELRVKDAEHVIEAVL